MRQRRAKARMTLLVRWTDMIEARMGAARRDAVRRADWTSPWLLKAYLPCALQREQAVWRAVAVGGRREDGGGRRRHR